MPENNDAMKKWTQSSRCSYDMTRSERTDLRHRWIRRRLLADVFSFRLHLVTLLSFRYILLVLVVSASRNLLGKRSEHLLCDLFAQKPLGLGCREWCFTNLWFVHHHRGDYLFIEVQRCRLLCVPEGKCLANLQERNMDTKNASM